LTLGLIAVPAIAKNALALAVRTIWQFVVGHCPN
jgi:hypothetical protein